MPTSNRSASHPCSARVSATSRTAVYGPVRTVVWEGRSREAPPYPDHAIVETQKALKADPSLAAAIGGRLFPPDEAPLIADLIARDAPFYRANISPEAVDGLNRFAEAVGLISEPVPYERMVIAPVTVAQKFGGLPARKAVAAE